MKDEKSHLESKTTAGLLNPCSGEAVRLALKKMGRETSARQAQARLGVEGHQGIYRKRGAGKRRLSLSRIRELAETLARSCEDQRGADISPLAMERSPLLIAVAQN